MSGSQIWVYKLTENVAFMHNKESLEYLLKLKENEMAIVEYSEGKVAVVKDNGKLVMEIFL